LFVGRRYRPFKNDRKSQSDWHHYEREQLRQLLRTTTQPLTQSGCLTNFQHKQTHQEFYSIVVFELRELRDELVRSCNMSITQPLTH